MLNKLRHYLRLWKDDNYRPLSKPRRKLPVEPWAFIRVKNEIVTIDACLKSILPVIKKGVIGYHRLSPGEIDDGTEEYIKKFCEENPGFILCKHDYEIIPVMDNRYKELSKIKEENTLAGYYNAVLSKIPQGEWLIKIDCDHVYDTEKLRQLMYLPKKDTDVISISRFNLHFKNKNLYVIRNNSIINPGDHWLIKNSKLKFYMECGENNGKFYAWEQLRINEKSYNCELVSYSTDLFNWHFPWVKYSRRHLADEENLIPLKKLKMSWIKKRIYHVSDDMLDRDRILEICNKFHGKEFEK